MATASKALSVRHSRARLADGMFIAASLRVRLFNLRLLTVEADIAVSPEEGPVSVPQSRTPSPAVRVPRNGRGGLVEAALRLDAGAEQLSAARERMP